MARILGKSRITVESTKNTEGYRPEKDGVENDCEGGPDTVNPPHIVTNSLAMSQHTSSAINTAEVHAISQNYLFST